MTNSDELNLGPKPPRDYREALEDLGAAEATYRQAQALAEDAAERTRLAKEFFARHAANDAHARRQRSRRVRDAAVNHCAGLYLFGDGR